MVHRFDRGRSRLGYGVLFDHRLVERNVHEGWTDLGCTSLLPALPSVATAAAIDSVVDTLRSCRGRTSGSRPGDNINRRGSWHKLRLPGITSR